MEDEKAHTRTGSRARVQLRALPLAERALPVAFDPVREGSFGRTRGLRRLGNSTGRADAA